MIFLFLPSLFCFLWEIAVWCCWICNGPHHFTGRGAATCFAGEKIGTRLSCHTFISSLPLYPPPRGSHMQMCPSINVSWLQTSNDLEYIRKVPQEKSPTTCKYANILCGPELQAWAKLCYRTLGKIVACIHRCTQAAQVNTLWLSVLAFCCESCVVILCFQSQRANCLRQFRWRLHCDKNNR